MKTPKKPKRVRLSLETTEDFKKELLAHGKELGEWSLIGALRASVRRSRELLELEREFRHSEP
jgi:hypothetical protein